MAKSNAKSGQHHGLAANFQHGPKQLPPIGVFWDIENCQVPKGKSAMAAVQLIRKKFFDGHREAEFMCVCDINKENKDVIQELNNAQVTVVHINATGKNAADDKLRQSMRRFADIHGSPSTIVLISGDVNFAADLSDFNHRRHIRVIVVHNSSAPEALLACAHFHYHFNKITFEIPFRTPVKSSTVQQSCELLVTKLPNDHTTNQIRSRLKQLSDNCGGRVISVNQSAAVIKFPTPEAAQRARKRMAKEDVFGRKISVTFPYKSEAQETSEVSTTVSTKKMLAWPYENGRAQSPMKGTKVKSPTSPAKRRSRKTVFPPPPTTTPLDDFRWRDVDTSPKIMDDVTRNLPSSFLSLENNFQSKFDKKLNTHSSSDSSLAFTWPSLPIVEQNVNLSRQSIRQRGRNTPSPCLNTMPPTRDTDLELMGKIEIGNDVTRQMSVSQNKSSRNSRRRVKSASQSTNVHSSSPYPTRGKSGETKMIGNCQSAPVVKLASVNVIGSRSNSPAINNETSFQPIGSNGQSSPDQPIEMLVTNLDQSIDANELRKTIFSIFQQHVMVLHVAVLANSEGNLTALVRVSTIHEAQYAISQLHRRKIGYKRIIISIVSDHGPSIHILKSEVQILLQDVPNNTLPLFKFRELFEKRYHQTINMSDLHKMKDLVLIEDDSSGRTVRLNPNYRDTPSPASSEGSKEVQAIMEKSFCELHCPNPNDGKGWAEKESAKSLPNVHMTLKDLTEKVHALLESHNGDLPLGSFLACYEHEFGPIEESPLDSVPLEHLIASVPDITIHVKATGSKRILWADKSGEQNPEFRSISPPLAPQLTLFSREVVDLLKSFPDCLLAFVKFIPAYHHHFGRQCRVADYGFTKLIDLLEAVSHVVQVLGEGNRRVLTLTNRSQVKRFSSDVLRLLKNQASKQISLDEFAFLYKKCFGKEFSVANYGLCDLSDLLNELPENSVLISRNKSSVTIAIPKRDQTPAEIERTKVFSQEVIELLRHSPQCRMSFNKFIPAYHHHYGQQCRLSDYGFTKLLELFEAIPYTVQVLGEGDEKILVLHEQELLKVLTDQITTLIRAVPTLTIKICNLMQMYTDYFGHGINLDDFQVCDELDLISKLNHVVKVVDSKDGPVVVFIDGSELTQICWKIRRLLVEHPENKISLEEFSKHYMDVYGQPCNICQIATELEDFVQIDSGVIHVLPTQLFARNVHLLLYENNGKIMLNKFEDAYSQRFSTVFDPSEFGFANLITALHSISETLYLRGKGHKRTLHLNNDFLGLMPKKSKKENTKTKRNKGENSTVDLLSEPVPSGVPSPSLHPLQSDSTPFEPELKIDDDLIDGRPPSKPRAVTQESSDIQSQALTPNTSPAPGVASPVSVQKYSLEENQVKPEVQQPPSHSQLDISLLNGEADLKSNGSSRTENSSKSCENLAVAVESGFTSEENCISSKSTPTHQVVTKIRYRSRIAANFSHPPN